MKTIGILGGMSPESTVLYYQIINRAINERLGGNHSADIVMHSVDFETILSLYKADNWQGVGDTFIASARMLQSIGAECILIGTNTMHKVAPIVADAIDIPLLHVIDCTAQAIKAQGLHTIGLLGTAFTMQDGFYSERMASHGIQTLVPPQNEQGEINRIIFEELCLGRIEAAAKARYLQAITELQARGAQGIVLGCTEICLLITESDSPLPLFDSTSLHAMAAVDFALQD